MMTEQADAISPRRHVALPFPFPMEAHSPGERFTVTVLWRDAPPLSPQDLAKARRIIAGITDDVVIEQVRAGSESSPQRPGTVRVPAGLRVITSNDPNVRSDGTKYKPHCFVVRAPRRGVIPNSTLTGEPASAWIVHDILVDGRSQRQERGADWLEPATVSHEFLSFHVRFDAGMRFEIALEYTGAEPDAFMMGMFLGDYAVPKN